MPKQYPKDLRDRAVRLVSEQKGTRGGSECGVSEGLLDFFEVGATVAEVGGGAVA
jgi:hypothetical protein